MDKDYFPIGSGETILLVEDDVDVRFVTCQLLMALNYNVIEAGDGPSALQKLAELDESGDFVDLVFSDIMMPSGMNGIDLSIAISGRYPDTPVMLTSGYPDKTLQEVGMTEEDHRYMHLMRKPYGRKELAFSIHKIISGSSVNRL